MLDHTNVQLPGGIREVLPEHAQTLFRKAFNDMMEPYGSENSALCVAWEAVEQDYEPGCDGLLLQS